MSDALNGRVGAGSLVLGVAQVVVTAQIDALLGCAQHLGGPEVVGRDPVSDGHLAARHGGDWVADHGLEATENVAGVEACAQRLTKKG